MDRRTGDRRNSHSNVMRNRRQQDRRARRDRRRSPRIRISIWVEESDENALYYQRTGNLGTGGVYFENTVPHPVGKLVNLKFKLPDNDQPVLTKGRIVNTRLAHDAPGMGVQFIDLPHEVQVRINRLIEAALSAKGS